jgi:hypothetical protein
VSPECRAWCGPAGDRRVRRRRGASADEAEQPATGSRSRSSPGGASCRAISDAESSEVVATALDAEVEALNRADERDRRPIPERRAAALVAICRLYLAATRITEATDDQTARPGDNTPDQGNMRTSWLPSGRGDGAE